MIRRGPQRSEVERPLCGSELLAVGRWECTADRPEFPVTPRLANDLFVFADQPLWWDRGSSDARDWAFLEAGSVVMHRAGRTIRRRAVTELGDQATFFAVDPALFEEALITAGADPERATTQLDPIIPSPAVRAAQLALRAELEAGVVDPAEAEERGLTLLAHLAASLAEHDPLEGARPGTRGRRRRVADRARALLQERLADELPLGELGREVGASPFHLCRLFRDQVGMTLSDYRHRQRARVALERMQGERQDLSELAAELGYSSHSHFTRSFRRVVGAPPSRYNGA